jgi:hypothetical protein
MIDWNAVSALGALAGTFLVLIGSIFALRQVREAAKARNLQSFLAIMDRIDSPDLRRARWLVYTHHEDLARKIRREPTAEELDRFLRMMTNDEVDLANLRTYLASLENISILVMHNLAPDDLIEMYFGRLVPHHWNALGDFITYMRNKYQSDDYLQHLEMLNQLILWGGLNLSRQVRAFSISYMLDGFLLKSRRIKRRIMYDREKFRNIL